MKQAEAETRNKLINDARWKLIQKANAFILRDFSYFGMKRPMSLLSMKHIQHVVSVCRQNKLAKPEEYEAAGYRGNK